MQQNAFNISFNFNLNSFKEIIPIVALLGGILLKVRRVQTTTLKTHSSMVQIYLIDII